MNLRDLKYLTVMAEEQDRELRTKLQKDPGGWLWLFIEAAKAYKEHGLQDCPKVVESVRQCRIESSDILKWTDLYLEITGDEDDWLPSSELFVKFKAFLVEEQGRMSMPVGRKHL